MTGEGGGRAGLRERERRGKERERERERGEGGGEGAGGVGVLEDSAHMPSCHGPSARDASMPARGRRDLEPTSPCQYCSSTTWSIGHTKGSGCDEAASGMAQSASRLQNLSQ